jgi:hypothetical protein
MWWSLGMTYRREDPSYINPDPSVYTDKDAKIETTLIICGKMRPQNADKYADLTQVDISGDHCMVEVARVGIDAAGRFASLSYLPGLQAMDPLELKIIYAIGFPEPVRVSRDDAREENIRGILSSFVWVWERVKSLRNVRDVMESDFIYTRLLPQNTHDNDNVVKICWRLVQDMASRLGIIHIDRAVNAVEQCLSTRRPAIVHHICREHVIAFSVARHLQPAYLQLVCNDDVPQRVRCADVMWYDDCYALLECKCTKGRVIFEDDTKHPVRSAFPRTAASVLASSGHVCICAHGQVYDFPSVRRWLRRDPRLGPDLVNHIMSFVTLPISKRAHSVLDGLVKHDC